MSTRPISPARRCSCVSTVPTTGKPPPTSNATWRSPPPIYLPDIPPSQAQEACRPHGAARVQHPDHRAPFEPLCAMASRVHFHGYCPKGREHWHFCRPNLRPHQMTAVALVRCRRCLTAAVRLDLRRCQSQSLCVFDSQRDHAGSAGKVGDEGRRVGGVDERLEVVCVGLAYERCVW